MIPDYPKVIEIQFNNKCNSNCLICPYKDMHYNYEKMNDDLFYKILDEIDEKKLKRIIPYLNNEPFLDDNFVSRVDKIRKKFKNLEIEISTNVSVLKVEDIKKLSNMDITELRLSIFGYNSETYKRMMPNLNQRLVFDKLKYISDAFKDTKTIVSIVMIDTKEISENEFNEMKKLCDKYSFKFERWGFLDRSNNVSYKTNGIDNKDVSTCEQNRPIERMHILSNGDVIFCCQDWKHTIILGSLKENTISEIWNSKKYNEIRNSLYDKNKVGPDICQKCKLGH